MISLHCSTTFLHVWLRCSYILLGCSYVFVVFFYKFPMFLYDVVIFVYVFLYAHMKVVVACWAFFFVITRHHEVRFTWILDTCNRIWIWSQKHPSFKARREKSWKTRLEIYIVLSVCYFSSFLSELLVSLVYIGTIRLLYSLWFSNMRQFAS